MKRNRIRNAIGGLSFTTALFVFQACYGMPQDIGIDILLEGQVRSEQSGLPVQGIKVSVSETMQYEFTDQEGKFSFYTEMLDHLTLQFTDIDSIQNGLFNNKDTVITGFREKVYLDVMLEEK